MEPLLIESQYEIERGKPMPSKNHSFVQGNLYFHLRSNFKKFQVLPELSLQLESSEKVPDLAIFENIEFTPGNDEIRVTQMPLCAIEILSPKQNLTELLVKAHAYFDNGVKSYWLVLPALRSIYVFSSALESEVYTHKDILKDEQLGIELELKGIFG
jgi:Uma2 family endonuclease